MPTIRDGLLQHATWYRRFKTLIRADRATRIMAREYIRPRPGERILDVGCGDGDIRPYLEGCDYTGVDLNDDYLRVAEGRSDATTRFLHADVASLAGLGLGPFDVAIAVGLLHHLTDDQCTSLLAAIRDALVPGGRLITFDPVFDPQQRTSARLLAALDRGRYVRDETGYERLFDGLFTVQGRALRQDLLPFPYSHAIFELQPA
jgi:cyclopropane fatty-acyl-phospholipid synthase-like methyltransferase